MEEVSLPKLGLEVVEGVGTKTLYPILACGAGPDVGCWDVAALGGPIAEVAIRNFPYDEESGAGQDAPWRKAQAVQE
eukprot:7079043-Heterocapsa_arctica.AAC.1